MNVALTYLVISVLTLVIAKPVEDDDMLLYWRRASSSKCEPFTSYQINCNKCVCSADGTEYCTRMACYKGIRFPIDESSKIAPINDFNRPDHHVAEDSSV